MLTVLPFYHAFGLMVNLNYGLYFGIPNYILKHFDIVNFCKAIQEHRITFTTIVPPICILLARHNIVLNYDLTSLKAAFCGAAPLSYELLNETMTRLPHLIIRQLYGSTETSPLVTIEPVDKVVGGSVGILLPNMTAKIMGDDGNGIR